MVKVFNIGPKEARVFELNLKKFPNAFARVHHPNCGHCVAMKKEWNKFLKQLTSKSSKYKGDMGIFDIHADALPEIKNMTPVLNSVQGYPSLLGIKNNQSTSFDGSRTAEDMTDFCLQYLDLDKILKSYNGGGIKKRKSKKHKSKKHKSKKHKSKKKKSKKKKSIKKKSIKKKSIKKKSKKS